MRRSRSVAVTAASTAQPAAPITRLGRVEDDEAGDSERQCRAGESDPQTRHATSVPVGRRAFLPRRAVLRHLFGGAVSLEVGAQTRAARYRSTTAANDGPRRPRGFDRGDMRIVRSRRNTARAVRWAAGSVLFAARGAARRLPARRRGERRARSLFSGGALAVGSNGVGDRARAHDPLHRVARAPRRTDGPAEPHAARRPRRAGAQRARGARAGRSR